MTGISLREFARRDGCAVSFVSKAVKEGRLHKLPDGKLDEALVGSGWRATNRRAARATGAPVAPAEMAHATPAERAEMAVLEAAVIPPIADSEAKKEFFLAKLRELEYDMKAGLVSPNAEQIAAVVALLSQVRTRLLAIPSEGAPAVNRCKTVAQTEAEMRRCIVDALADLSARLGEV